MDLYRRQNIEPVLLAAKEVLQHEQLTSFVCEFIEGRQEWNHLLQPGIAWASSEIIRSMAWTEGRLKLALLAEVLLECEDQKRNESRHKLNFARMNNKNITSAKPNDK